MADLEVRSRERIHIRTRESGVTLSAWKVTLANGGIVLAESAGKTWYRGEGALLGKSQDDLAALWKDALPKEEPGDPEPLQLG